MRHYCITCKSLICIECIVDHSGHEFVRKEESGKSFPFFIKFISHYFEGKCWLYCKFNEQLEWKDRITT